MRSSVEEYALKPDDWDHLIALAGNPNTGKSTIFNGLTGLHQHTGNWPGKTVSRAEGSFSHAGQQFKIVDLPGAYSLHGVSRDESVAADFLAEVRPAATVVVLDATALERNLAYLLQIRERTPRVVVALNLLDEARARGLTVDVAGLSEALGLPVISMEARRGKGFEALKAAIASRCAEERDDAGVVDPDAELHHHHETASELAEQFVTQSGKDRRIWQDHLDHWLTHPLTGFPIMALVMAFVLWLTITGANVPSAMLGTLLLDTVHPWLRETCLGVGLPEWLVGLSVDGVYLTLAWVVSVMLPPMAIFFPLFTLLEDFGYLPRVAFNLDPLFQKSGAHGKQALTMAMGYGCNAAGIIATRIIESPRERLIAILTNNFALCNGRWPTQILIASIFFGGIVGPKYANLSATAAVFIVGILGVLLTFVSSWLLSKTLLKGEASAFTLEMPPLRPPNFWRTLYTSLIDRTIFVLWRAIIFAAPAGAVIWVAANWQIGDASAAAWMIEWLNPVAVLIGLNGVILLAYIIAIPANEIVVPTILMLTVMMTGQAVDGFAGNGVLFETNQSGILQPLLAAGGWTLLTATCLMLFSLCHNPCSTALYTIYKETGSVRWTVWAAVLPTVVGVVLCGAVTLTWQCFG
ncbi:MULTISPECIES: ferrous iron transporter B [unclassified Lentimonas]|uniref:ferrous iron transporter B n=1 Tax=unclassified Lentimonas TaxID=2630993 RepID=UPI00132162A4|nr:MULTISPECIES: ferrous iron transporter B [unclassified Lentimonas]CAA6676503.1 Ferrous iron transport protein B [Lentimonas sp. CC4]CAA6685343.1 Ferrous iron transport protein B [Lentimonas sp. CC6]CAA7074933.1 Ferrous iron transport protein B [Lentimonas sp. CC4]CAA7169558.1 Ferrous iron transport protein B [Lentimonas sp. CC21]CAA7182679.1 Ferrous iron transport protein B [Lentimonas sp. CC8]